jgi:hypothetical protein
MSGSLIRQKLEGQTSKPVSEISSMQDLYPAAAELQTPLANALKLLQLVHSELFSALSALRSDDLIDSDDRVQRAHAVFRELFCLRNLGDGFGIVINSCLCSLDNKRGEPLNEKQIIGLAHSVDFLASQPFASAIQGAELAERLEALGLEVYPQEIDVLGDWLIG